MITIKEACQTIIDEYPQKNYELDRLIEILNKIGGEKFICSDNMWRCYGKKKFINTLLRQEHH